MILLALGSNRAGNWGDPHAACAQALDELDRRDIRVVRRSPFYRTAPMGPQNQPAYVNAVAELATTLMPARLLHELKSLERAAGRGKGRRWGARELDLDLLAYHRRVTGWPRRPLPPPDSADHPGGLVLPHPGLHRRQFVLRPLCDIAPLWHHPVTGLTALEMLRHLGRLS